MIAPLAAMLVGVCIICGVVVYIESSSIDSTQRPHVIDVVRSAHEEERRRELATTAITPTGAPAQLVVDDQHHINRDHRDNGQLYECMIAVVMFNFHHHHHQSEDSV